MSSQKKLLTLFLLTISFYIFPDEDYSFIPINIDIDIIEELADLNQTPPIDAGISVDGNIMLIYPKGYLLLSENLSMIPESWITLFNSSKLDDDISFTPAKLTNQDNIIGLSADQSSLYIVNWLSSEITQIRINAEGITPTLFSSGHISYYNEKSSNWKLFEISNNSIIPQESYNAFFWILTTSSDSIFWVDKLSNSFNSYNSGVIDTDIDNIGSSSSISIWAGGYIVSNNRNISILNQEGNTIHSFQSINSSLSNIYGNYRSNLFIEIAPETGETRLIAESDIIESRTSFRTRENDIIDSLINDSVNAIEIIPVIYRTDFIDWLRKITSEYRNLYPLNFELSELEKHLLEIR